MDSAPGPSEQAVPRISQLELEAITMATASQKRKVEKVMHEYKEGDLKSNSGRKVKSRRQAVAIAMSESGQSKRRKKAS
jgi:hypothetical protein